MTRVRLCFTALMVCLPVLGQTGAPFRPSIQISDVRGKFAKLAAGDQSTSCTTTGISFSNALLTYCQHLSDLFDPTSLEVAFASYVVAQSDGSLLKAGIESYLASAADSRIDTQNGASSGGSGTTSVAERSGISDVLGIALEAGGVTQSVSGTNLTLQANALSLYRFLTSQNVFQYCPSGNANCRGAVEAFLNRISGSATLGLSSSSTQAVTGTVSSGTSSSSSSSSSSSASQPSATALIQNSASHLTGFSVRYQAINTLDLRSQAYLDAWTKAISSTSVTDLAKQADKTDAFAFFKPTTGTADEAWMNDTAKAVETIVREQAQDKDPKHAKANDVKLIGAIIAAWDKQIPAWKSEGMTVDKMKVFLQAASAYMLARDAAVDQVRQSLASGLTFEYSYARPDNQPLVSTLRAIYTLHPGVIASDTQAPSAAAPAAGAGAAAKPKTTSSNDSAITFNFAADLYDNPPAGTHTLKDLQAALQLDHHFGSTIATLAGYYQYQSSANALTIGTGNLAPGTNITLNGTAATLLAPKGNMVVAQAMVTFALKSGTKLPLGVTWSNRTDLIKGNELRGHVGFNFDWSALLLNGQAKTANPAQP